ncbi:MAG: deoxyuridine 5'-triphosphate nucleotidohydrolase [Candidatus Omnitrophica bacterium]|nr:deoxyuridine 5'-triphosphate nucleotidohydrolase [Candidatus Omnitrophota bacterium]
MEDKRGTPRAVAAGSGRADQKAHTRAESSLNKAQVRKLISDERLIEDYVQLDIQLTPNGFDLTAGGIFSFCSSGRIDFSNQERQLAHCEEMSLQRIDPRDPSPEWWVLSKGVYKIKTNETVNLPDSIIACAFTRTSLLRMGVTTSHGVWDAGFEGKGEFLLNVENPRGVLIKKNARIAQLVFFPVSPTEQYQGIYRHLT